MDVPSRLYNRSYMQYQRLVIGLFALGHLLRRPSRCYVARGRD